ncbi:MAG TPA: methionine--tRNA ligase [Bacteroidales bacterium]|nr:methionine--tRNA ligase [Bacteroidales bacterium]HRT13227.1 methionine--tRNA ligase [Bacteroidales bacterium]
MSNSKFKRHTVTTALPYANGPIHIGHLAGVYVPADIYVRYLRANRKEVLFICGSDEHGVPITISAKNENITPQAVVDRYHEMIKKSFKDFGISFDIYSRTSNPLHHETASDFFTKLYKEGKLIEKTSLQYYDEEAKQFLADRYLIGTCPHCNNEKAYGDQCEACGTSLNATDLINPISTLSGKIPVQKETKHWYLPLQEYENWLREWILERHKEDWKSNVYGQCKSWIDQGLQPRAITRDLNWGVKVPLKEAEGKVLYVWFDAPIGYISATKEWAKEYGEEWEKWWKDDESRLIHFIGKDNIVFHCIIFPIMLKAEGSYILPDNVPANEFLNLESDKISTSRNWAVWLHEYLETFKDMQDVLRYTLTSITPETKDADFTWLDFQSKNNNELLAIFGNFVNRTVVLTHKFYNGKVPEATNFSDSEKEIIAKIGTFPTLIGTAIEKFKFREALAELMNLARIGNKYLTDTEPWQKQKENPEEVKRILFISLQICASLSILCKPFLPFTSKKLQQMLNIQIDDWQKGGEITLLPAQHQINKPIYLFEKIDDKIIEEQIQKLNDTKQHNLPKNLIVPEGKEDISFDEFQKVDLRIATILAAEAIPKTKKLLKLKVDTGIDVREVVSGIAEYYKPETLIGKQILMLANLTPKNIKGVDSHGMILMAENEKGELMLVQPSQLTIPGSTVK